MFERRCRRTGEGSDDMELLEGKSYVVESTVGIAVSHHLNSSVLAILDAQARRHNLF